MGGGIWATDLGQSELRMVSLTTHFLLRQLVVFQLLQLFHLIAFPLPVRLTFVNAAENLGAIRLENEHCASVAISLDSPAL